MTPKPVSPLPAAAPFWMSLLMLPLVALAARMGGAWWLLLPLAAWFMTSVMDSVLGLYEGNPDPRAGAERLFWHRAITIIWFPLQFA
ncbi:MAG: alkane 1-monooxygenase, partial [Paracoccus sp. (in: a-proteobacteria)]